nr:dnaJ homolog dnj-5 [Onthophagus taurus]
MEDSERNRSSERIQYPDYMFSEIRNQNDQFRPMGFQPQQNSEVWTNYLPQFNPTEGHQINMSRINNPSGYNFCHTNQVFHDQADIFPMHMHQNIPNTDLNDLTGIYPQDYKYPGVNLYSNNPENGFLNRNCIYPPSTQIPSRPQGSNTAILENVLGNWTPTSSGTYSPFGNVPSPNLNIFEHKSHLSPDDLNLNHERPNNEDLHFQFANRDTRKPRMVAEVKPMRPTYSDVLLKSVPTNGNVKPGKIDHKDIKIKKDTKKCVKNEKSQKINGLNRSNTTNEIKEVTNDKNHTKSYDKSKENKSNQLNRKWVSLDDVSEPFTIAQEVKEKKTEENATNKPIQKNINNHKKQSTTNNVNNKSLIETVDTDSGLQTKNESYFSNNRTTVKKNNQKSASKQKGGNSLNSDYQNFNNNGNRKGFRGRKKENQVPFDVYRQKLAIYLKNWWKFCVSFILWLFHLVADICSLSWQIWRDSMTFMWTWTIINWASFKESCIYIVRRVRLFMWIYEKFNKPKEKEEKKPFVRAGLQYNINMPQTGEEAMKRLLACKGKDPYSILGVTPACTDDDIKRYYKKQAVLVHPDKNKQPGAEEAFKILVHAFDMINEPERRAAYDRGVAESAQVEQAWTELTELLAQFQQKVEAAAKTIRCSYCGSGHKRTKIERPTYAARNCNMCKIFHAAREGDIWAEATCFGLLWNYYACMDGGVYDITDWASCQKNSLKQLKPDSHNVQYRIALGKSQPGSSCKRHSPTGRHSTAGAEDPNNLENLLNKFYGQNVDGGANGRRRNNRKKFK